MKKSNNYPNWNPESHEIFRSGPNDDYNACIGTNGGPYDSFDYGIGYLTSAEALCEHVITEGSYQDSKIYPTIFMLRHGVELYMKGFLEQIPPLFGDAPIIKEGHGIRPLWNELKPYLQRRSDKFDNGIHLISSIEKAITNIEVIDESAQVFRYPNPKNQNESLVGRYTHINFERVLEFVRQTLYTFEAWRTIHDDIQAEQTASSDGNKPSN